MPTLKRLGAYGLAFILLLTLLAVTRLAAYLDHVHFEYQTGYLGNPEEVPLSGRILLVDLPRDTPGGDAEESNNDPSDFRRRLGDLLVRLADAKPAPTAVVLDISFMNDSRGLPEVSMALGRLTEAGVETWAVLDPGTAGRVDAQDVFDEHAMSLYRDVLEGYGHTVHRLFRGVLSYQTQIDMEADGGVVPLPALPVEVARRLTTGNVERSLPGAIVLAVGSQSAIEAQTLAFDHSAAALPGGRFLRGGEPVAVPDFNDKIVVVGSLAADVTLGAPQAGPNLVAWAVNDRLSGGTGFYQPETRTWVIVCEALAFAVLTVLVYAVLFKYVKRLQTRPLLLAVLSVVIGAGALAALAFARFNQQFTTPVGLPLFAIGLAGLLAWHFALKFLVTGVAEGSGRYDAFISYSHAHADWVVKHLYEPLKATRKPDGSEVTVFFDRDAIGVGEAFTTKYMWAIVDSRVFIPVFSDDYYSKNHCRNEMDVAYKRKVEKLMEVVPIAYAAEAVPEIYRGDNYLDPAADPNFIERVREAVLQASAGSTPEALGKTNDSAS